MSKEEFFSLQIIFYALIAGPFMFMIVAFITASSVSSGADAQLADTLLYVSPALILGGHLIGSLLFSRLTTKDKLFYSDGKVNANNIRTAYIIRWATLEGPMLFSIICYMLTANMYFIYFFVGGVILYMLAMPKRIWENVV
jgi:hypothetical protein